MRTIIATGVFCMALTARALAAVPGTLEVTCDVDRTQFRALTRGETTIAVQVWDAAAGGTQCGSHVVPVASVEAVRVKTEPLDGIRSRTFLRLRMALGSDAAPADPCADRDTWIDVRAGATTLGCDPSGRRRLDSVAYARRAEGSASTMPTGAILPYAAVGAPADFLPCDGSAVSRAAHANLFQVIGTTYGAGDGSTTFNLPDLRGRVVVGRGVHADVASIGLGDAAPLTLRSPRHRHTVDAHVHATAPHTHRFQQASGLNNGNLLHMDPSFMGPSDGGIHRWRVMNVSHNGVYGLFDVEGFHQDTFAGGGGDTDARSPATDAQGPSHLVVGYVIKR